MLINSWKLNWVLSIIKNKALIKKNKQVLSNPNTFWLIIFLKLVPFFKSVPVNLHFKSGDKIKIVDFMSLFIYTEIFIDECYDLAFHDEKTLNIIDIGSNTGMFILRMKQCYPNSFITGYEPMPFVFKQLSDNLNTNGIQNYKVFQKGVGGKNRIEKLYIHPTNIGGNSFFKAMTKNSNFIEIEVIDIHEMLANIGDADCDLIKLDCEGAEYEILKSLTAETAARIKRIIYEPTPSIYNPSELNDYLSSLGYHFQEPTKHGLYVGLYQDVAATA